MLVLLNTPPVTPQTEIDAALSLLQAHKDDWSHLAVADRLLLLDEVAHGLTAVAERWVAASCAAKGIAAGTFGEAEEWLFFAVIARGVRLLRQALSEIQKQGRPSLPGPVSSHRNGQVVVQVIPHSPWDHLLFRGVTGEAWLEPGVTVEELLRMQASAYQDGWRSGKVAVVLGAGNASMLPVIDTLHKLFVENQVVALKPNPVNAYLGPLIEEAFQALISRGYLQVLYGREAEGAYLCQHTAVDELHLTGSARTFEAITFGPGQEGAQRKLAGAPLNKRRFTCELGNVSPIIIVPGPWQAGDVKEQAEQIATWFVANAGYGCLTPRIIIQHKAWALRHTLVAAIGDVLAAVPSRQAYYPGARERHAAFVQAHPEARHFGRAGDDHLPWTFVTELDPDDVDDICFREEAFCSLMAETALEAADVPEYLGRVVEFANNILWGTLNATLIVHPASLREPGVAAAVERAVADLRYGAVLVNMGSFAGYYYLVTPWGGFPGHTSDDIQSGIGKTANFLMLARPQKSVIRGPFKKWPDPLRVTATQAPAFARKLAYFEMAPSLRQAPGLMGAALWRKR